MFGNVYFGVSLGSLSARRKTSFPRDDCIVYRYIEIIGNCPSGLFTSRIESRCFFCILREFFMPVSLLFLALGCARQYQKFMFCSYRKVGSAECPLFRPSTLEDIFSKTTTTAPTATPHNMTSAGKARFS